jgi:hypothetical protein
MAKDYAVKYDVERGIEEHWYPIAGPTESDSAAQAVARAALTEGVYRARPTERAGGRYELFRVPALGAPISLGLRDRGKHHAAARS